jgi:hypothetical protein
MQQQTRLIPNADLAAHTWRLIEEYPDYDQASFDLIDKCIEQLPTDITKILVGIFWVLDYMHDAFVGSSRPCILDECNVNESVTAFYIE